VNATLDNLQEFSSPDESNSSSNVSQIQYRFVLPGTTNYAYVFNEENILCCSRKI
jgi:hypothetical protein